MSGKGKAKRKPAKRAPSKLSEEQKRKPAKGAKGRPSVFVAYPSGGHPDPRFHSCMVHLLMYDAVNYRRAVDGAHMQLHTTNLPLGRNQIVRAFLENAQDCEWLWFVDDDMTFPPEILDRLLEVADPKDRPIVGALAYSYNANEPEQKSWPTVWTWGKDSPTRWATVPRDTLLHVDATGTGCVLIHRSVFEKVAALPVPDRDGETFGDTPWPWFQYAEWKNEDGKPDIMGEDLTFFARATAAGVPVHVHTSIRAGHIKPLEIDEAWHLADLPFERRLPETYVVVPVRDRLDLTRSLLEQLEAQGGYREIFLFDNGSGAETKAYLRKQRIATVFDAPDAGIYAMWNAGICEALDRWPKPNVVILNNDLRLGENFLPALERALRASPDDVIAVAPNYDGREIESDLQLVQGISAGREDGTGGLPGFAFAVAGEAFAGGVPMFDERYSYWFGDTDWLLTLDRLGLRYGIAKGTTVEHLGGGSQTDAVFAAETEPRKLADRTAFLEKWEKLGGVQLVETPAAPPEVETIDLERGLAALRGAEVLPGPGPRTLEDVQIESIGVHADGRGGPGTSFEVVDEEARADADG